MPSGDAFSVGRSGLLSFQRVLTTISHNITNVNTEGYSRQRTDLSTRFPTPSTAGFIGTGVKADSTRRLWDEHATNQVRNRESTTNSFSGYKEFAAQVDNILADPDAGLAPAMESFFVATQGLSDDPTSVAARGVLLTEAEALVDRMHTVESWISDLRGATNDRITNKVVELNAMAETIADMNYELIVARGLGGGNQPPNDLLDRRDHVITELSKVIGLSLLEQDDGSINVYIGNGMPLVIGNDYRELQAGNDPNDPLNFRVTYVDKQSGGAQVPITNLLTGGGGDLGGVLAFREDILNPTFNSLGRLAVALTMSFNDVHYQGMDLNNQLGGDFFRSYGTQTAVPDYKNAVPYTGTVNMTFVDEQFITTDEYDLTYDGGGNYTLRNLTSGGSNALVAAGGPPTWTLAPQVDGFEITVNDPAVQPAVGDRFFIRPTRGTSRLLETNITDPSDIAAAKPVRTDFDLANLGSATISEVTITNPADPNLINPATYPVEVIFSTAGGTPPLPADQYQVFVAGVPAGPPAAYAGGPLTVSANGWDVVIDGDAWDGDRFVVEVNTNGFSDNTNALALADLQISNTMGNGNATYHDSYSELVVSVGNNTHRADISLVAQEALLVQAKDLKEGISGVNLDEEAANLLRFQQAYAAAAQVISSADQMFQTLIAAVRG